jgi:hypothetical protein
LESAGYDNALDADDLKPAATSIGKHGKESALNDDDASVGNKKKAKKNFTRQVTLPAKK